MKQSQQEMLTIMYACQICNTPPVDAIAKKWSVITPECIQQRIDDMVERQIINKDRTTLTDVGKSSLHIVLAGGVFDIIHPGHIYTLKAAKALGGMLIVVVATDKTAQKMKRRKPQHSEEQRREMVESLQMVDLCLIGHEDNIFETVKKVWPETIALGYDQIHQEKYIINGCREMGLNAKVARLQSPIPDISSSEIQKEYGDAIHDI